MSPCSCPRWAFSSVSQGGLGYAEITESSQNSEASTSKVPFFPRLSLWSALFLSGTLGPQSSSICKTASLGSRRGKKIVCWLWKFPCVTSACFYWPKLVTWSCPTQREGEGEGMTLRWALGGGSGVFGGQQWPRTFRRQRPWPLGPPNFRPHGPLRAA